MPSFWGWRIFYCINFCEEEKVWDQKIANDNITLFYFFNINLLPFKSKNL